MCEQQKTWCNECVKVWTYHCWYLARHQWLGRCKTHLLHQRVLQGQMVTPVYQKLVLQMLWWMEIFAWGFFPITSALKQKQNAIHQNPPLEFNYFIFRHSSNIKLYSTSSNYFKTNDYSLFNFRNFFSTINNYLTTITLRV